VIAIDVLTAAPLGGAGSNTAVVTKHSPDVEMRAIWHPVIGVRDGEDLRPLLRIDYPFTVAKASVP
jgi:hypothetical protein